MICALELEREQDTERLGEWPFEIALWVGRAATPNYMGYQGDRRSGTARLKVLNYARDSSREPPLPIEECPWCGTRFNRNSFQLDPNANQPTNLWVYCANRHCDFHSAQNRHLPIVAVDEPIYERLPAFMIATADKFAALPWTGDTARFFQGVDASNPQPPDLIIQDELHLISGPLGTMAGLYETAIDHLCSRQVEGHTIRPKVIASTATVRLARKQIRALFARTHTEVFPAPGVDRRDSFFARQIVDDPRTARAYVGLAAQGRGPKVIFLRCMTTLMAAAQAAWNAGSSIDPNPADPYMTVVAYFNALRELGSARRNRRGRDQLSVAHLFGAKEVGGDRRVIRQQEHLARAGRVDFQGRDGQGCRRKTQAGPQLYGHGKSGRRFGYQHDIRRVGHHPFRVDAGLWPTQGQCGVYPSH